VRFVLPAGRFFSPPGVGSDPEIDSNANPITGRTAAVTIESGDVNLSIDAGVYQLASVGDRVWHDLNANGIEDIGEPGLPGVTVTLTRTTAAPSSAGADAVRQTIVTDARGRYLFENLRPGTFVIGFVAPPGFIFSPRTQDNPNLDSNPNPASGVTDPFDLSSSQRNLTFDAGLFRPASVGQWVWLDTDNDALFGPNEKGIPGVIVNLYPAEQPVVSTSAAPATLLTDTTGRFQFNLLPPGDYFLEFIRPAGLDFVKQSPPSVAAGSDADPATGRTVVFTLSEGEIDLSWQAGLALPLADDPEAEPGTPGRASGSDFVFLPLIGMPPAPDQ
jgi:hypothetical protein